MLELLSGLRKKVAIGFVGGSDLAKISEQLAIDGNPGPPQHSCPIPLFLNPPSVFSRRQVRLRICRERVDRLQIGETTLVTVVYQAYWRRQV